MSHISRLKWKQFSSAARLHAFLTSLKRAQVINCCRLNPSHILQLYLELPQQKQVLFGRIKCPAFLHMLQAFWHQREHELLNLNSQIRYGNILSVQT